jgi:hypothetical protein
MTKLILTLLLCSFLWGQHTTILYKPAAPAGGEVSPDIEITHDTSDDLDVLYDNINVNVTKSVTQADVDSSIYFSSGNSYHAYKNFNAAKTEVWIEFWWYPDEASWSAAHRFVALQISVAVGGLFLQVRNDDGYKWAYHAGSNVYANAAPTPQQGIQIRLHVVRSDDAGVVDLDYNIGAGWVSGIDATSIDTDNGVTWGGIIIGYNQANELPAVWYYDTIKIYYSDPGW